MPYVLKDFQLVSLQQLLLGWNATPNASLACFVTLTFIVKFSSLEKKNDTQQNSRSTSHYNEQWLHGDWITTQLQCNVVTDGIRVLLC